MLHQPVEVTQLKVYWLRTSKKIIQHFSFCSKAFHLLNSHLCPESTIHFDLCDILAVTSHSYRHNCGKIIFEKLACYQLYVDCFQRGAKRPVWLGPLLFSPKTVMYMVLWLHIHEVTGSSDLFSQNMQISLCRLSIIYHSFHSRAARFLFVTLGISSSLLFSTFNHFPSSTVSCSGRLPSDWTLTRTRMLLKFTLASGKDPEVLWWCSYAPPHTHTHPLQGMLWEQWVTFLNPWSRYECPLHLISSPPLLSHSPLPLPATSAAASCPRVWEAPELLLPQSREAPLSLPGLPHWPGHRCREGKPAHHHQCCWPSPAAHCNPSSGGIWVSSCCTQRHK